MRFGSAIELIKEFENEVASEYCGTVVCIRV